MDSLTAAAGIAALGTDLVVHPLDTLITRLQAAGFDANYRTPQGSLRPALFRGLYNGIGPVLATTVPASVAFFSIYELSKSSFNRMFGGPETSTMSQALGHAGSSAIAELVACAIINPAEVLKQNAQVAQTSRRVSSQSPVFTVLKKLIRNPTGMWAGYSALIASRLPATSLTFSLFEHIKHHCDQNYGACVDHSNQVWRSACAGGASAAVISIVFVPIDVIKTRARLLAIDFQSLPRSSTAAHPLSIARHIWIRDGFFGFFRGAFLTCFAAAVGGALYLGCYDGLMVRYTQRRSNYEDF